MGRFSHVEKLCKTPIVMPLDWPSTVENLKNALGTETVERWIAPLKCASESGDAVVLEAPNPFFRDWVQTHYHDTIQDAVGGRQLRITSSSIATRQTPPSTDSPAPTRWVPPRAAELGAPSAVGIDANGTLNAQYTFDRFVVGSSNRFAHAASMAVSESPAKAYNPLFMYGGVGLGKTHLMQAVGNAVARRLRTARVFYTSSEQFTNELITAIQTRATAKFRERYRTADVLLIDDIHFIAGKESTQEEFFHTFNALYDAHKQIVVSSDRPPKDIAGLEQRLVSRFEWGLVTDIQPPDFETRMAILLKKAEEAGTSVPDAVMTFIAGQITTNIRELEGALIRVVAYCRFFSKPLSVGVAQDVLKDMVREVGTRLTLETIQRSVASHFQLPLEELKGVKRQRSILYPRQIAMYLARTMTDLSLPEIGRGFGGKDHSTVLHAVEKITRDVAQDIHKKHTIEQLIKQLATSTQSH